MTTIQEKGVTLLREKNIAPERLGASSSVDSKPEIFTEMAVEQFESKLDSENKRTEAPDNVSASTDKQIPSGPTKAPETTHKHDEYKPVTAALYVEEKPASTDWLNERHGKDTDTIHLLRQDLKESEKERYAETVRGDDWRNKFIAADRDSKKKDIDIANLKHDINKLNILLEQAYQNDKLMDGVMRLYLETKGKLNDSVEGEVSDKWR